MNVNFYYIFMLTVYLIIDFNLINMTQIFNFIKYLISLKFNSNFIVNLKLQCNLFYIFLLILN